MSDENLATLEAVANIQNDKATPAEKVERLKKLLAEPDLLEELEKAFPDDAPQIIADWKALLKRSWENLLSRPRAWKVLMSYAKKAGIDF